MGCSTCHGKKVVAVSAGQTCPKCQGRGEYDIESHSRQPIATTCSCCFGRGKFDEDKTVTCWWCVLSY